MNVRCHLIPAVALAGVAVLLGCGAPTYYTPKTELIAEKGAKEAASSLEYLLEHASAPIMSEIQVTDREVAFRCERAAFRHNNLSLGREPIRFYQCDDYDKRIDFAEVVYIDIVIPDDYLVLRNAARRRLFRIKPRSQDEARQLVDLLASFRDRLARQKTKAFAPLVVEYKRAATPMTAAHHNDE